jgi:hypothetical protein
MRWEVRGLWNDRKETKWYDDRERAYEAFQTMVRSDPTSLELYEIEDGHEPRRLRRYEIPRLVKKGGPRGRNRRDA